MILIIILLLLLAVLYMNQVEHYVNLNIYPSRLLGMQKFAKLHNGKIISLDIKPIEPTFGETQCLVAKCPQWFMDNMVCYNCM